MTSSPLLTPRQAAEKLGISYPAIKHWILAGTFPVNSVNKLGRTVVSNNAFQYHTLKKLWPEVEINSTFWEGGTNDGKKQTFVTPGLVLARFPIHKRVAFVAGAGFQIATIHYNQYNHAFIGTLRIPF